MIKIAIADDHTLFKAGIIELIQAQPDMQLLFEAQDGAAFIESLSRQPQPDIALIDLEMPGMNGIQLTTYLRDNMPSIKIIVLSAYAQERFVVKMIESGASAFLSKAVNTSALFDAIRQTWQYGFYMTESSFKAMQRAGSLQKTVTTVNHIPVELSQREKEVLKLICLENTNQEIADRLFVSVRTIEGHRNNLLLKTGCKNTAGLVMFAIRHGLADLLP
ncbi:MAG: response regulator transcription factor [Bacteroidota bacterium]|nr:response regulator transcription factor [Bacteroidota bacterium]